MAAGDLEDWAKREGRAMHAGRGPEFPGATAVVPDSKLRERTRDAFARVLASGGWENVDAAELTIRVGVDRAEFEFSLQRLVSEWDGSEDELCDLARGFAESLLEEE